MATALRIAPCLWFDNQAEEAADFYVSIFKKTSRIVSIARYGEAGREFHQKKPGSVMTVEFELDGQPFTALNGGPEFTFNEAISMQVMCDTQDEIDYFWKKLLEDGEERECGWLKDKFGISWQVVPRILHSLVMDPRSEKSQRAMNAMLTMRKLNISQLEQAYDG